MFFQTNNTNQTADKLIDLLKYNLTCWFKSKGKLPYGDATTLLMQKVNTFNMF